MRKRLMGLYGQLLDEHGPQGWWPAHSEYEVVVGALLTQNTSWKNAEKAIANLQAAGMLSPEKVLEAADVELEALIRPSGFYRQKAGRLKGLTRKYMEIKRRRRPGFGELRAELLSVKGVGKETADSIILYAFGMPVFVVDEYTRRFCAHHGFFGAERYDDYRHFFEANLPRSAALYNEYHALIVQWGSKSRK